MCEQRRKRRVGAEGDRADEHLVRDDREGVAIGGGTRALTGGLLGRHVLRRSDERAGLSEARQRTFQHASEAEVRHDDVPITRHEHVRRLDVTVNDVARMRVVERAGDRAEHPRHVVDRQWLSQLVGERPAVDEFRDDVVEPVLIPVVVDREDVRVAKFRDRHGLGTEPFAEHRVVGEMHR